MTREAMCLEGTRSQTNMAHKIVVCSVFAEFMPASKTKNVKSEETFWVDPLNLTKIYTTVAVQFHLDTVLDMCLSCGLAETYA